jgi:hypothetical protein
MKNLFIKESILPSFNFSHFSHFETLIFVYFEIFFNIKMRITWNDPETDFLVSERRRRNEEYHRRYRGNKTEFWESISRRIYRRYNSRYSARQCEQKWRNLVRDYGVSK